MAMVRVLMTDVLPLRPVSHDEVASWRTRCRIVMRRPLPAKAVADFLATAARGNTRSDEVATLQALIQMAEMVWRWGIELAQVEALPWGIVMMRFAPGSGMVWHVAPAEMAWAVLVRQGFIEPEDGIWFLRLDPDGEVVSTVSRRDLP